jgi:hypothetical protein
VGCFPWGYSALQEPAVSVRVRYREPQLHELGDGRLDEPGARLFVRVLAEPSLDVEPRPLRVAAAEDVERHGPSALERPAAPALARSTSGRGCG